MSIRKFSKFKLLPLLVISAVFSLVGCGGGGGSKGSGSDTPEPTPDDPSGEQVELIDFDSSGKAFGISSFAEKKGEVEFSENSLEFVFKLNKAKQIKPTTEFGTITRIDDDTFKWALNPEYLETWSSAFGQKGKAEKSIKYVGYEVNKPYDEILFINNKNEYQKVSFPFFSDPFIVGQWYIRNVSAFLKPETEELLLNLSAITTKADLNLLPVWLRGYTGKGTIVAVIDEDLEITHEDLKDNISPGSKNFADGSENPAFNDNDEANKNRNHGTAVAGIIASSKNHIGTRGLAYDAKLVGYNYLNSNVLVSQNYIWEYILNLEKTVGIKVDVINQSYGPTKNHIQNIFGDTISEYLIRQLAKKNVTIVNASGNEYNKILDALYQNRECIRAEHSTGTVDCNLFQLSNSLRNPFVIVVGANSETGLHANYGTTGSQLVVSAFGGNRYYILTTDRTGCEFGYNNTNKLSASKNCEYTSAMNGSSSATPEVSAIVSLMKSANKNLNPLQAKYALIMSTQNHLWDILKRDPKVTTTVGSHNVENHNGWLTNGAGLKFNNKYGFGIPDAAVAVDIALNCDQDPYCAIRSNVDNFLDISTETEESCKAVIEENGYNEYICNIPLESLHNSDDYVFSGELLIDEVGLALTDLNFVANGIDCKSSYGSDDIGNICTQKALSNLQIELYSPSGQESIIKPYNTNTTSIDSGVYLLSRAFYQETTKTTDVWKVRIISQEKIKLPENSLFEIKIYGYEL